ncbi:MAG: RnfABCDGE type electron transport complex subunit B [Clostridiales bacterium]|nr:RnfABCDGE type electron transport complex subunit B [Clostridiales bacterium]
MVSSILVPVLIVGGMGLIFGVLLGIASKVFAVKEDERIPQILEVLPGANCGGCGFAGCSAYASALCKGGVKTNMCPVGGEAVASKISEIMGVENEVKEKLVARVLCNGNPDRAVQKYYFDGPRDCHSAARLGGGEKMCAYGCLGFGSCVNVCKFGAMSIKDGVAYVDIDKCVACGACAEACPKKIIKILPLRSKYTITCKSVERGGVTRHDCQVGCIGCGICAKTCPKGAIAISDNLAVIDPSKCVNCGLCAQKCPRGAINKVTPHGLVRPEPKPQKPKLTPEQIAELKAKKAAENAAKAKAEAEAEKAEEVKLAGAEDDTQAKEDAAKV